MRQEQGAQPKSEAAALKGSKAGRASKLNALTGPQNSQHTLSSHVPLLLAILISLSVWIYLYTEYFPVFGSIIGLSGVLVVVPAMRGLMSKKRQEAYAAYFDQLLFQSHLTAKVYVVCLLVIAFGGFLVLKPARFSNASTEQPLNLSYRSVTFDGNTGPWYSLYLQPRQTKPIRLLRPIFGGTVALDVRVPGLPLFRHATTAFGWPRINLPSDAWREPVLIVRPDVELMARLRVRLPRLAMELRRAGEGALISCQEEKPWLGSPIWIGGGTDLLTIPAGMKSAWQNEHALAALQSPDQGLALLTSGIARRLGCSNASGQSIQLLPNDELQFTIEAGNGDVLSESNIRIKGDELFPLEVVARVRTP